MMDITKAIGVLLATAFFGTWGVVVWFLCIALPVAAVVLPIAWAVKWVLS